MIRLRRRPEPPSWDDDGLLTQMRREQQVDDHGPTPAEWEAMAWREIDRMTAQHWWAESQAEYDWWAESQSPEEVPKPARRRGKTGRFE